ncbi:uncharacterized protein LOC120636406 [Pararge aegeria]|uniref:uncharacterized protein LOC120636406 n=1 Tax=Pararge aegeria TaxID=116150 RepID=UPI0019D0B48B|nr:uncharacterized protein LOC120636406 [Pararge aegeria]
MGELEIVGGSENGIVQGGVGVVEFGLGTDEIEEMSVEVSVRSTEVDKAMSDSSLMSENRPRSGSESSANASGRLWQGQGAKRPRLEDDLLSSEEERPGTLVPARIKDRRPTVEEYVGLVKSKETLKREERAELRRQAEDKLLRESVVAKFRREIRKKKDSVRSQAKTMTAAQIQKQVLEDVALITKVAKTSTNLKGTFVRDLKDAVASITDAIEVLGSRTISEETRQLQNDNSRLQAEMASLRSEMAQLREDMERVRSQGSMHTFSHNNNMTEELPPVPQPQQKLKVRRANATLTASSNEELCRSVMVQVGEMVNARLASFEDRLLPEKSLRPPLAADKKRPRKTASTVDATIRENVPGPNKPTQEKNNVRESRPAPTCLPSEGQWEKVSNRKKKGRNKKRNRDLIGKTTLLRSQEQPQQQGRPQLRPQEKLERKLRPPRSAAVVLTLQPGAEEKGVTYATVLNEAKKRIVLPDLGITALRFKRAAAGGRILEVPGASSSDKADSLAQKLKEIMSDDVVRVSRPIKSVEMRVSGLDDSVSGEEVVAAIAQLGGCPAEQVRAGDIRSDNTGLGTLWIRCPIAAAKKVAEGGRLLVGWISAQVKVLDVRSQLCYRCWQRGHMKSQCTNDVDRSKTCYRCGQEGHKARGCSAAPHCSVCAASGKMADHRVGSSTCGQSNSGRSKKQLQKGKAATDPRVSSQSVHPPSNTRARDEEASMSEG